MQTGKPDINYTELKPVYLVYHYCLCQTTIVIVSITNAPINIMLHYPPPGQGGDLNYSCFKFPTYWAYQSVKSRHYMKETTYLKYDNFH